MIGFVAIKVIFENAKPDSFVYKYFSTNYLSFKFILIKYKLKHTHLKFPTIL